MKARSLRYLIGEGLKNIWHNRLMSIASVGVLSACMLMMGIAVAASANIDSTVSAMAKQNIAIVIVKDGLTAAQTTTLMGQVSKTPNVISAAYATKDQNLEELLKKLDPNSRALFEQMKADNSLPNSITVKFADPGKYDATVATIQAYPGVDHVQGSPQLARRIANIEGAVQGAGLWLVILLMAISLVIISNTVRITMHNRRLEISIMRAVGATSGFIRLPFVIEGVCLGVFSSAFSLTLLYAVYHFSAASLMAELSAAALPFTTFFPQVAGLFFALGLVAGLIGSVFSIGKYLRNEGSAFYAL